MELHAELDLARRLLKLAEDEVMPYFGADIKVDLKADKSPVTEADRRAEEAVRRAIEKETPGYGVIGEEFGSHVGREPRQWVVDPIDGTKSFIHGVPLFGTLLALLEGGRPVMGLIGLPALNITLWAVRGQGCFVDGRPCRVSRVAEIDKATLVDEGPGAWEKKGLEEPWRRLRSRGGLNRGWGDCYGYYLVATGRAEIMADPEAEIWDLAPMAVIIPEAGGRFSSLAGGDFLQDRSGLATNGLLHDEVLKALAPWTASR